MESWPIGGFTVERSRQDDRYAVARAENSMDSATSVFTRMSALARQYDAVNLGQGFPDFPGPDFVKEAAKPAIDADLNQYAVSSRSAASAGAGRDRVGVGRARSRNRSDARGHRHQRRDRSDLRCHAGLRSDLATRSSLFEPFYDSYPAWAVLAGATFVPVRLNPPDWSFVIRGVGGCHHAAHAFSVAEHASQSDRQGLQSRGTGSRSPNLPSSAISWSSPTRSTTGSHSTAPSTFPWRRCLACGSERFPSTRPAKPSA